MSTDISSECMDFMRELVPAEHFEFFLKQCRILQDFLYETNKVMNLTRIPETEFWSKHVCDSLSLAKETKLGAVNLCDVGCGAGFPSLVLAAAFPDLRVLAVDSTRKKVEFVIQAADKMGLDHFEAIHARANELGHDPDYASMHDIVTARAVSDTLNLRKEVSGLMRNSGKLYVYRAPEQAGREVPELKKLKIAFTETPTFELPEQAGTRLFLILKKGSKPK